jgi:hypothetical protein
VPAVLVVKYVFLRLGVHRSIPPSLQTCTKLSKHSIPITALLLSVLSKMVAFGIFALSFSFLAASAQFAPANRVELAKRAPYAGGGWAYNTGGDCPPGTTSFGDVSIDVCCPNGFTNDGDTGPAARVCCPSGKF